MMEGPWFGIVIMVAMVVGIVWWVIWAMRSGKVDDTDKKK
jgi:nitrogen fixation-related uncharacterized protein